MGYKPTEGELEILNVLWKNGPSTVREIHEQLGKSKEVGYTTTLKLMQIMTEKGALVREESGRSHIYKAVQSREHTRKSMVSRLVDSVFNGSSVDLVMQALGQQKPTEDEVKRIKEYLNNLEK